MTENENKVQTEENIKTAGAKKDARMLAIALGIVVLIIWAIIIAAVVRVVGLFHDAVLYDNIDDLLARDDIDAVYIASPVICHERQALAAAKAGKNILIEKPISDFVFMSVKGGV